MAQEEAAPPAGGSVIEIGALAPLTRPGWFEAGQHLLAGLELGVADVNAAGGISGRAPQLLVRDTAADAAKAGGAVEELRQLGVAAVVGEFHSVVARAVAAKADALGLPFLCSSAVIDALTDAPSDWVARLPPAQSRGWRLFAEFLLAAGHSKVTVATEPSVYWAAGTAILREQLEASGGSVLELDARALDPQGICDALAESGATALLLLVAYPQPAVSLVRAVRHDPRLAGLLIGAPAGQPEPPEWLRLLGDDGLGIPFLRYLPEQLPPLGMRVARELREQLGEAPSFVGFEGYDTALVLAELLRLQAGGATIAQAWSQIDVAGSRGQISFSRVPGIDVWQWAWAPIQVSDRDPASPNHFRVLRAC